MTTEFVYCPICGQQYASDEPLLHCACGKVFTTIPGYTLIHEAVLARVLTHAFRVGELTAFTIMTKTVADNTLKSIDELLDENAEVCREYVLDLLALICKRYDGE